MAEYDLFGLKRTKPLKSPQSIGVLEPSSDVDDDDVGLFDSFKLRTIKTTATDEEIEATVPQTEKEKPSIWGQFMQNMAGAGGPEFSVPASYWDDDTVLKSDEQLRQENIPLWQAKNILGGARDYAPQTFPIKTPEWEEVKEVGGIKGIPLRVEELTAHGIQAGRKVTEWDRYLKMYGSDARARWEADQAAVAKAGFDGTEPPETLLNDPLTVDYDKSFLQNIAPVMVESANEHTAELRKVMSSPGMTWKNVKEELVRGNLDPIRKWVYTVVPRAGADGLFMTNPYTIIPYIVARTDEMAEDRAERDERGVNPDDFALSFPAAIVTAISERFGIRGLGYPKAGATSIERIGTGVGRETLQEAAQNPFELAVTSVGTKHPATGAEYVEAAETGAVAGALAGGGITTTVEAARAAQSAIPKKTPEQLLDEWVRKAQKKAGVERGRPEKEERVEPTMGDEEARTGQTYEGTFEEVDEVDDFGLKRTKTADATTTEAETTTEVVPVAQGVLKQEGDMERTVKTQTGTEVTVMPEVIDAANLIPASDDLQPRDRDRATMKGQESTIAANLDPDKLMPQVDADRGAPIIGPDNVVESGNGRVQAIITAFAQHPERAEAYKQRLIAEGYAETDIEGMSVPILVQRRSTEMTDDERKAFVRDANIATAAKLSASEQSVVDADVLDASAINTLAGADIAAPSNRAFARQALEQITSSPDELNNLITKDGELSQEGVKRLQGAVLAKAYPGQHEFIASQLESTDDDIRSVTMAFKDVAGDIIKTRNALMVVNREDYEISGDLADAAEMFRTVKKNKISLDDFEKQGDLVGRNEAAVALLNGFFNESTGRAAGREKVAQFIRDYLDSVPIDATTDMFGGGKQTKMQLIWQAVEEHETRNHRAALHQGDIFVTPEGDVKRTREPEPAAPTEPGTFEAQQFYDGPPLKSGKEAFDVLSKERNKRKNADKDTNFTIEVSLGNQKITATWVSGKTNWRVDGSIVKAADIKAMTLAEPTAKEDDYSDIYDLERAAVNPTTYTQKNKLLCIACSATKGKEGGGKVRDVYKGGIWEVLNKFEKDGGDMPTVLVFSGKYGWLTLDTVIPAYDEKLTEAKTHIDGFKVAVDEALDGIAEELGMAGAEFNEVMLAGGQVYREAMERSLNDGRDNYPATAEIFGENFEADYATTAPEPNTGIGTQKANLKAWLGGTPTAKAGPAVTRPSQEVGLEHFFKRLDQWGTKLGKDSDRQYTQLEHTDDGVFEHRKPTWEKDGVRISLTAGALFKHKGRINYAINTGEQAVFELITVDPEVRRQGKAKQAVQDVFNIAEETGVTLFLEPTLIRSVPGMDIEGAKGLTKGHLVKLYKSLGAYEDVEGDIDVLVYKPWMTVQKAEKKPPTQEDAEWNELADLARTDNLRFNPRTGDYERIPDSELDDKKAAKRGKKGKALGAPAVGGPAYGTNRPSLYRSVFAMNGVDPNEADLWPEERQIEFIGKKLDEKFGIKLKKLPGANWRYALDTALDAYNNLHFLAEVLGLAPEAIGLEKSFDLLLRRKGTGKFGAEFYPQAMMKVTAENYLTARASIGIPDRSEAFAHEWGHALDWWLLTKTKWFAGEEVKGLFVSGKGRQKGLAGQQPELLSQAFADLLIAIYHGDMTTGEQARTLAEIEKKIAKTTSAKERAKYQGQLDRLAAGNSKLRTISSEYVKAARQQPDKDYWAMPTELLARSFESYVSKRMADAELEGTEFLHNGENYYRSKERTGELWPKADADAIFNAYDNLFKVIRDLSVLKAKGPDDGLDLGALSPTITFGLNPSEPTGQMSVPWREQAKNELNALKDLLKETGKRIPQLPKDARTLGGGAAKGGKMVSWTIGRTMGGVLHSIHRKHGASPKSILRDFIRRVDTSPGYNYGTVRGGTFEEATDREITRRSNNLRRIYRKHNLTKKDNSKALYNALVGIDIESDVVPGAADIRRELIDFYYYLQTAGVEVNYAQQYLPRLVDMNKVELDKLGFRGGAIEAYKDVWDQDIVTSAKALGKALNHLDAAGLLENKAAWKPLRTKIKDNAVKNLAKELEGLPVEQVGADWADLKADEWLEALAMNQSMMLAETTMPGSNFTKRRVLTAKAEKALDGFMVDDAFDLLDLYIRKAVRRAEWERRFGSKDWGGKGRKILYDKHLQERLHEEGFTPEEIWVINRIYEVTAARQKPVQNRALRAGLSWGHNFGMMIILSRAWMSALAEPITIRSAALVDVETKKGLIADVKETGVALQGLFDSIRDVLKEATEQMDTEDKYYLSELLAVVADVSAEEFMQNRYDLDYHSGSRLSKITAAYFEATILAPQFRIQRRIATNWAWNRMMQMAESWENSPHKHTAIKYELTYYGVPETDIEAVIEWLKPFRKIIRKQPNKLPTPADTSTRIGKIVEVAVNRYVDRTIMNPRTTDRMLIARSVPPMGAISTGILGFSGTYFRNLVAALWRRMQEKRKFYEKRGGYKGGFKAGTKGRGPNFDYESMRRWATYMAVLYSAQLAATLVRTLIFQKDDWERWAKDKSLLAKMAELALYRTGVFGYFEIPIQIKRQLRYQKDWYAIPFGPTGQYIVDSWSDIAAPFLEDNSRNTNTSEYKFARGVYALVLAPLMVAGIVGAGLTIGPITAILAGVVGGTLGLSQTARNAFAGLWFGKKGGKTKGNWQRGRGGSGSKPLF